MADPPPIRRPTFVPPPIPPLRTPAEKAVADPVAPAAVGTVSSLASASGVGIDEADNTQSLDAPIPTELVEEILAFADGEAAALLVASDRSHLADLHVRCALARWDALEEPVEALRLLELADRHPLALRMRLSAALADAVALESVEAAIVAKSDDAALYIELAEAWLWRHGRVDRARVVVERLLAAALPEPTRTHVRELAILVLGKSHAWTELVRVRREALRDDSSPEEVAAVAALILDRTADAASALATCWPKLEHFPGFDDHASGWLRVFDVALDAATILDDDRRFELLDQRAELVARMGGAVEALATRHAIASELDRDGQHAEAAGMWQQLASDPVAREIGAASKIAWLRAAWSAIASGTEDDNRSAALAARRALADAESSDLALTHAWRALELATLTGDGLELARTIADASPSLEAERWIDLVELDSPTGVTLARLEHRGGHALRWAAAIAERLGDPVRAIALWKRATDEGPLATAHDHVIRLLRGGDDDLLAEAYAAAASTEPDGRTAAALWCARAIADLVRGELEAAEQSLQRGSDLATADAFARAGLATLYRSARRPDRLAKALVELATVSTSKAARAAISRERAALLGEQLEDPAAARAALENLLADHADDFEAMLSLARLHERADELVRASELRRRAAELAPQARRGGIWMDVARVDEARGDRDAAASALEKAAIAGHPAAAREQARLLRLSGGLDRALALLREELAAAPKPERRTAIQSEIAQILTELDRDPAHVVAALLDVLDHEPAHTEALAWIEAPAKKLGLWDELARAYRNAPATPRNLEILAEALAKLGDWSQLVDVKHRQIEMATTAADKARRGTELARIYEYELGDLDGAIRMLVSAQAAYPEPERQHELLRLLRSNARWGEVVAVLERELPTVDPADSARQVEILVELGTLRATQLGRFSEAVSAYESVLDLKPDEPRAIEALLGLYDQLGRERELARVMESRAESAHIDNATRAKLYERIGQIRADRDDIDGALAAYGKAFAADPTNRDVFTGMERVCYKAERWPAALQLYADAIAHVEGGHSRAYRLGDLYARRGNVQLNFLGEIEAAIQSYQKVVEVDSNPAAAVKILEDVCQTRGNWQLLISAYEKRAETQRDPARKADALAQAARIAAAQASDPRQSIRLNRKLLAMDPTHAGAAAQLEAYYEDVQDRSGLVDVLKLKLQQASSDEEAVDILKKIARAAEEGAKDVETATEHYKKILEIAPKNRDALDGLARIYESTEQWAEFVDITRKQIEVTRDPNTKALMYFRCGSVIEAKFGREADAIRYYEKAIRTSTACLPAVHGLRDLYRRREDWRSVIETLELEAKVWQDDKERAGVFAQIGRIHEKQLGDVERAMTFYETAIQTDSECLLANQALFEHYFERGDWKTAQTFVEQLSAKAMREGDPQTRSEFFRQAGHVARMMGDPRRAAEDLISAVELKPTNSAALDDLGTLARESPDAWDFEGTYVQLEKVYKKRDDADALLARVYVGRAAFVERAGDLDQAVELYRQAVELAPTDFAIVFALVSFHFDMRQWDDAVETIAQFVALPAVPHVEKIAAQMRRAEIHADGEMEPDRAIRVLLEVLELEPEHQDAYYQLAQQCFLLGQYPRAHDAIDRVIDLATAPGQTLHAPSIARYYYYKGRILDASGEARAAAPQYRRAIEYDPGYAPPALVLARRAADAGDQRQAETLLIDAAHAAMATAGQRGAVPLQRGLARILLASGDRPAAIEAYRGILNVEPDGASDRVALAEIYAVDDPRRAVGELRKVLDRDIHHAPAYRMLAAIYSHIGDRERAYRALVALDSLGFSEDTERALMLHLRSSRAFMGARHSVDAVARDHFLLTAAAREPLAEVFEAFEKELTSLVAPPSLGINLTPALHEPRIGKLAAEVGTLFEVDAELFVAEKVPGLLAVTAYPRRLIVVDRTLLGDPEPALRFLFGYALEAIRGGYAMLLHVGARKRHELALLLRSLLAADAEAGVAVDLINNATDEQQQVLEAHAGTPADPSAWMDGMLALAKRAGLLACDDFSAAIWMVARLAGEQLAGHDPESQRALGSVLGGSDLVRFYLSDDYQQLRDRMVVGG